MSIYAISWVLQHSRAVQGDRLVLIALADYANDEGGSCYPSIPKIAAKARLSERQVERCLNQLVELGEITEAGRTPRGSKAWKLTLTDPRHFVGSDNPDPDICDTGTPTSTPSDPDICSNGLHREPSKETSEETPGSDSLEIQEVAGLTADAVIQEVFEAWRTGTGLGNGSKLTPDRRKKIMARLQECIQLQPQQGTALAGARVELLEAVAGMVGSKWHQEQKQLDFTLIFRSAERVQTFRDRAAERGVKVEPPSVYDTTKKNPELEEGK